MSVEEKTEGRNDFPRILREYFKEYGYDFEPHPSSEEVGEEEKVSRDSTWFEELRKFFEKELSHTSPHTEDAVEDAVKEAVETSENPINNEM